MPFLSYPFSLSDLHKTFYHQDADGGFLWIEFHPAALLLLTKGSKIQDPLFLFL